MSTFYVKTNQGTHGPLSIPMIREALLIKLFRESDLLANSSDGPWMQISDAHPTLFPDNPPEHSPIIDSQRDASDTNTARPHHQAGRRPTHNSEFSQPSIFSPTPGNRKWQTNYCPACGTAVSGPSTHCSRCHAPLGPQPSFGIQSRLTAFVQNASKQARQTIDGIVAETRKAIDEKDTIIVENAVVFGRSSELSDWVITDTEVAPTHARVVRVDDNLQLHCLKSRTGTIVNESRITPDEPYVLSDGDCIQIGSASFLVRGTSLLSTRRTDHAHVRCQGASRAVEGPDGSKHLILNDVTLNIPPSSFVVLLGPSGSGKSTLLGALNGRACATSGRVLLNQEDLYANYGRLRNRIANVPQKDNLHFELSLKKSLLYTSRLKLPRDTSADELEKLVDAAIAEVGMTKLCDSPMKIYSGGQIKRASVAHEILSRPSLICVDEATSGLDEHSDREIMGLLREIADRGKTILCITHNIANVQEFCDTIIVMANGGHLAFVGSPSDALDYFAIDSLHSLYLALNKEPGEHWGRKWRAFTDTVADGDSSNAQEQRRILNVQRDRVSPLQHLGMALVHGRVVLRRTKELAQLDRVASSVMRLQPLLVCIVMLLLFGALPSASSIDGSWERLDNSLRIAFLLVVSAFWFGCSNSAKEIVKERGLYEKERHAGLNAIGYLSAKAAWLLCVTIIQAVSLLFLVKLFTGMDGSFFSYLPWMTAIAACGVSVGLCISVFAPNSDVAVTAVPLVLIPQVVLGGMIKQVDGLSEFLAGLIAPCYWAYGGIANVVCSALGHEVSAVPVLDAMLAPSSPTLSFIAMTAMATILLTLSGLTLNGVKVANMLNTDYVRVVKAKAWMTLQGTSSPTP